MGPSKSLTSEPFNITQPFLSLVFSFRFLFCLFFFAFKCCVSCRYVSLFICFLRYIIFTTVFYLLINHSDYEYELYPDVFYFSPSISLSIYQSLSISLIFLYVPSCFLLFPILCFPPNLHLSPSPFLILAYPLVFVYFRYFSCIFFFHFYEYPFLLFLAPLPLPHTQHRKF